MAIQIPAPVREVLKSKFGISRFSQRGETVRSKEFGWARWRITCDGETLTVWSRPLDRRPKVENLSVRLDGDVSAWCDEILAALDERERVLAEDCLAGQFAEVLRARGVDGIKVKSLTELVGPRGLYVRVETEPYPGVVASWSGGEAYWSPKLSGLGQYGPFVRRVVEGVIG